MKIGFSNPFKGVEHAVKDVAKAASGAASDAVSRASVLADSNTVAQMLKANRKALPFTASMGADFGRGIPERAASQMRRLQVSKFDNTKALSSGAEDQWNVGTTIWKKEWTAAEFGKVSETAAGKWGSFKLEGTADAVSFRARVYRDWSANLQEGQYGALVGAHARFELLGAHYAALYSSPTLIHLAGHEIPLNLRLGEDAFAGAEAYANVGIHAGSLQNDIYVGGAAFAGASAAVKASIDLGGMIGAKGMLRGWAGAGVRAQLSAGVHDGKLDTDFGAGAALGLGGEVELGMVLDAGKIAELAQDVHRSYWKDDPYREFIYALNNLSSALLAPPNQPENVPTSGGPSQPPVGPQGPSQV